MSLSQSLGRAGFTAAFAILAMLPVTAALAQAPATPPAATPSAAPAAATPGAPTVPKTRMKISAIPGAVLSAFLTLTPDQSAKIDAIESKAKTDAAAAKGDRVQQQSISNQADTDVNAQLTPAQQAAADTAVPAILYLNATRTVQLSKMSDLHLTPDQATKLETLAKTADDQQAAAQNDLKQKIQSIQADFKTSASAVFTDDQKAQIGLK